MSKFKIIYCDLDGTLIKNVSGEKFPQGVWDMTIRFEVLDRIKLLNPECVLIVSNQGGIESGHVNAKGFSHKINYITHAVAEYCNCKCYSMYCTSNDESNSNRKPNTGMLEVLTEKYVGDDFDYIKQHSLMVGDASSMYGKSDIDRKTAYNFGIPYIGVDSFINL